MDSTVFSESISNVNILILRIPYPVFMGQREESDNDLGMLASVNWGDKEGSWDLAEEEYRPCLHSSNHLKILEFIQRAHIVFVEYRIE